MFSVTDYVQPYIRVIPLAQMQEEDHLFVDVYIRCLVQIMYRIYLAISRAIFPLILMTLSKIFAREGGSAYSREFSGESFCKDSKTVIKVR